MKPFFLSALLSLLLGLGLAGRGAAQCTVNTPPCATPFVAIDVATGQPVQALCVGRAVRFELGCGRTVALNLLYYNALPGTNITPANCDFTPARLPDNTYTPTAAGALTISELANPSVAGGTGTVYVRNFQVYASPPPQISVQACARNTASLLITNNGYDSYFAQVDNGPLIGPLGPGSISLPAAAGRTITVTGRYNANTLCSGQTSAVVPALVVQQLRIPTLTVQGPLPGAIDFTFSGLRFSNTNVELINQLQVADPATPTRFRGVVGITAPTTYSLGGLAREGLYRLANYDACGLDSTFSESVPAINLAATSANNVNTVTWPAFGPVVSYTLLRNGAPLATLPPGTSRYPDAAVTCGTRYTYRLQTTTVGGSLALSSEVTVQAVSALPPPAPLLNASFDLQNRLTLTARQAGGAALAAGGQLRYSRQGGTGNLDFAPQPTAPDTLRDPAPLADLLAAPPCYTVRLQDVCGNTAAASPTTCPSLLTAVAADPEGLTARLSWSAFRGPDGAAGVSYRVLTLAPDGTVLATSAATTGLNYLDASPPTDRQVVRYRVQVSGGGLPAGTVSYSNVASLTRQLRLVVPNAFTPNGDGLNDVLELKGRYLSGFTFVVIDRNGQEAFRATDRSQTWDGTIRGHAPVNAAYVWRFTQRDETGQEFSQTGTVTILK